MPNMKERFKTDLIESLNRIQKIYSAANKLSKLWGENQFCMKFTTYNDTVFAGFYALKKFPSNKKVHPYFCFKLVRYDGAYYRTGYLFVLSMSNKHNYYLMPDDSSPSLFVPSYGLVTVNPTDGTLNHLLFNSIVEAIEMFGAFAD